MIKNRKEKKTLKRLRKINILTIQKKLRKGGKINQKIKIDLSNQILKKNLKIIYIFH